MIGLCKKDGNLYDLVVDEVMRVLNKHEESPYQDIIVKIAVGNNAKELAEEKAINEYLMFNGNDISWVWLNDWNEGETFAVIWGITPMERIKHLWRV